MHKHSIATLYLSGPTYANEIAANLSARGFKSATIVAGLGLWELATEVSFVVTIIGETASPAHMAYPAKGGLAILMPADPDHFEASIRTLAENLAMDYKQDCVAFTITPCLFELTSPQAGYRRVG